MVREFLGIKKTSFASSLSAVSTWVILVRTCLPIQDLVNAFSMNFCAFIYGWIDLFDTFLTDIHIIDCIFLSTTIVY
jgi:hypothetical protein